MPEPFYDIILYKPSICCLRKHTDSLTPKTLAVQLKNTGSELTEGTRKDLDKMSSLLKEGRRENIPDDLFRLRKALTAACRYVPGCYEKIFY